MNLFKDMFDFNFTKFITPNLIKVVYVALIVAGGIGTLLKIISGFKGNLYQGIVLAVGFLVLYLASIAILRIWAELTLILFKIEGNTRKQ